jgi:glycosyltransferase involved in cell wall biosynthesis
MEHGGWIGSGTSDEYPSALADKSSLEADKELTNGSVQPRRIGVSPFESPELRRFTDMSLSEIAETAGLRKIDVVAWRDYDDPEAGGSELHAHRILSAWAKAGLKINMTTSTVPGAPMFIQRDGYRLTRRVGRYSIFPRTMISGVLGHLGRGDGLVEIWNGMPFLSPLWARCPRVVFLHHVHAEMWNMVLPQGLAQIGYGIEHSFAPPIYRHSRIVTLSSSSKGEIVNQLGIPASNVTVSPPGVESHFSPGTERSEVPLIVAVGRLVPVKRFEYLIEALLRLKPRLPDLRAVIVGEGYERPMLEGLISKGRAEQWISLPGYVDQAGLIDLYRKAWVVASSSLREGWGMTVTEAGACSTPSVASRISGHQDAVIDGQTGFLFDDVEGMIASLNTVLTDDVLRKRMGMAAFDYASQFSWDATARGALAVLAAEAIQRR